MQIPVIKTHKSLLHEFFQRKGGIAKFETVAASTPPAPHKFLCRLFCPGFIGDNGEEVAASQFEAEGRSKRLAEHAAAELALQHFQKVGLLSTGQALPQPAQVAQVANVQSRLSDLEHTVYQLSTMSIGNASNDAHSQSDRAATSIEASDLVQGDIQPPSDQELAMQRREVNQMNSEQLRQFSHRMLDENAQLKHKLHIMNQRRTMAISLLQHT